MRTATLLGLVSVVLSLASVAHGDPPDGPSLPEADQRGATRAQAIEAYAKDCHATLQAVAYEYEEEKHVDECLAIDVYQNCSPDTFGCYDDRDKCERACQPTCGRCQDTCAASCDDCKAGCAAGDAACVGRCAEGRADCRGRCMTGLGACQNVDCAKASQSCMSAGVEKLRGCSVAACDTYLECLDGQDDYERAPKICAPKAGGMSEFCLHVCGWEHGIPQYYFDEQAEDKPAPPESGKTLAKACTKESECPADYAALVPYLAAFCGGALDEGGLAELAADVAKGRIAKRTLGLVFNAYAAMYGYEFKKELWMNGFFYGAGGAWLPAACKAKLKSVASAKVMPFKLTLVRDRVKKIWNAAK